MGLDPDAGISTFVCFITTLGNPHPHSNKRHFSKVDLLYCCGYLGWNWQFSESSAHSGIKICF